MFAYLEILRPLNCLMTAFAVLIGGLLVAGYPALFVPQLYLAMLAAFVIAGYGNVINDYVDIDADKLNKPKRTIPSGRISPRAARYYAAVLDVIGFAAAALINPEAMSLAVLNASLLWVYAFRWKYKAVLGNAVVSWMVGSAFLFGGAVFGNFFLPLVLTLLATLANLAREMAKVMEDLEGDKKAFLNMRMASKKAGKAERLELDDKGNVNAKYGNMLVRTGAASLLLAVAISPLPYLLGVLGTAYLAALVPADAVFLYSGLRLLKATKKSQYASISRHIKLGMLLGLLAFVFGILF